MKKRKMKWFGVKKNSLKWWSTGSEGELDRNENKWKTTSLFFFKKIVFNVPQLERLTKDDAILRRRKKKNQTKKKEKKTDKKKRKWFREGLTMLRAAVEPARSDSLAGGWRPDRARLLAALLNDCDGGQAIPVSPLVLPNSGLEKKTNKKVFF